MERSTSRATLALSGTASVATIGLAGAALAARRERISLSAWLITRLALPLVVPARRRTVAALHRQLERDRAAGPAKAPRRIASRYDIEDAALAGTRTFRLRCKEREPERRVLYLHGGAYLFSLMRAHWGVFAALADGSDAEIVAPLYPLAPEHHVEDGLSAAFRAYKALAADVGAANIVLAGDSSGGGLALALAHRLRDLGEPLPAALVLFAPWLDATLGDPAQPALAETDPMLSIEQLREAGRMWAGELDPSDLSASPLLGDQSGLPPSLVLVGTRDLLLSDARRFAERAGGVELREYPGMFHGWIAAPIPEARHAIDAAATFIRGAGGG